MTLQPYAVKSPLTRYNDTGIYHNSSHLFTTSDQLTLVSCRYPWQTPIGYISDIISETSERYTMHVGIVGDTLAGTTSELELYTPYGAGNRQNENLIGYRVYFDGTGYCVSNIANFMVDSSSISSPRGLYPGAGTIGYIKSYDYTTDMWTISIAPHHSRAKYTMGITGTGTTTFEPVTLVDNQLKKVSYDEPDLCVGIMCGLGTVSQDHRIVCRSGPCWLHVTYENLYTYWDYEEMVGMSDPHNSYIDSLGSLHIDATRDPHLYGNNAIIGSTCWDKFPTETDIQNCEYMLIDVHLIPGGALSVKPDKTKRDIKNINNKKHKKDY